MELEALKSPVLFLKEMLPHLIMEDDLRLYEAWWETEGKAISAEIDRRGTPWLKMFDVHGKRIDEIVLPPDYWTMLHKGYEAGAVWRAFEDRSLIPVYLLGYVTAFYDTGLYCPYTVSLSTAVPASSAAQGCRSLARRHLDDRSWGWLRFRRRGGNPGARGV